MLFEARLHASTGYLFRAVVRECGSVVSSGARCNLLESADYGLSGVLFCSFLSILVDLLFAVLFLEDITKGGGEATSQLLSRRRACSRNWCDFGKIIVVL